MTRALSDSMVKACLFLLVAVTVADDATCAASSPGCPSKMQADANTLLQTGVRIGDELAPGRTDEEEDKNTYTDEATNPHKVSWMQEGMNTQQLKEKLIDNSKGKGRHDVLIQLSRFVNTLGNATKHFNSSNADNLKEVIEILRAVMYKSMNTDHTEDQTELNQAFAGITTCNTDLGKAITDNVEPRKNTMLTARSTHTTCRSEESDLETIKDRKWNEMLTHIAGISTPPSVTTWPVTPTYDTLVPYFSTGYAEWFVRQKQAFDTKNNAYVSANTNWTTSKDKCDSDQTTFENDFCVYNAVLDTTCLNHNTCHISASSGASTTTARVEVTEAARKEAYKAGEEIVCRINALLANRAYSECDNLAVDTSNYSIVYPTADAKASCVTEAQKPCNNTWKDTEYNGLPSNAPNTICTPCQAPSMAPTVAPTTQPIQAKATCASFSSCNGAKPVNKGSTVTCSGYAGSCDSATCCEAKATCNSFSTCNGPKPVNKGITVTCSGNAGSCDSATCCEAKATCNSFSTCNGAKPVNKGSTVKCSGNAASCDVATCCNPQATCNSFSKCTAPLPINKGSGVKCSGNAASCNANTCCAAVYYKKALGATPCPTGERITTSTACRLAHDELGLHRNKEWAGTHGGMPGGCSTRQIGQPGQHDFHWNTAYPGAAASDIAPICKFVQAA